MPDSPVEVLSCATLFSVVYLVLLVCRKAHFKSLWMKWQVILTFLLLATSLLCSIVITTMCANRARKCDVMWWGCLFVCCFLLCSKYMWLNTEIVFLLKSSHIFTMPHYHLFCQSFQVLLFMVMVAMVHVLWNRFFYCLSLITRAKNTCTVCSCASCERLLK